MRQDAEVWEQCLNLLAPPVVFLVAAQLLKFIVYIAQTGRGRGNRFIVWFHQPRAGDGTSLCPRFLQSLKDLLQEVLRHSTQIGDLDSLPSGWSLLVSLGQNLALSSFAFGISVLGQALRNGRDSGNRLATNLVLLLAVAWVAGLYAQTRPEHRTQKMLYSVWASVMGLVSWLVAVIPLPC